MKRLWRWLIEPVPTARFYFYGFWILVGMIIMANVTRYF